ncbi:hypothetical protein NRIC_22510 [Enterococcus florum]|uniref:DUF6429 domain-containing protein n=1 Tax=Enterococcus florum TaxID=2480627 RepID=A0A4P5P904_9ENTE|nr:DUF6429 family protein [Enterococcus florum]GCF94360.1 hypothetical protein NRIC_22510 [Enterococcus florum]
MTSIEELTLMLLYLSSWEETYPSLEEGEYTLLNAWKGYDFSVLNKLTEEDLLFAQKRPSRTKSVTLTDEGEAMAKRLLEKYNIAVEETQND